MTIDRVNCQTYKFLLVKSIDGEISSTEQKELQNHLQKCSECRKEFEQLKNLKEVTSDVKKNFLPEMAWEEYWRHLYNRLERGFAWIFISIGAIILLGYAVVGFVSEILETAEISSLEKFGILSLTVGAVILFVSVLREKLITRKHDKYKEVQR